MQSNDIELAKKYERLKHLTTQTGWQDFLDLIDERCQSSLRILLDEELTADGINKIIEARASIKSLTNLINRIYGDKERGELILDKLTKQKKSKGVSADIDAS